MSSDKDEQDTVNSNPQGGDADDPNMAKDPVCGMLVDKRTAENTMAAPVNDKGVGTLYFSSAECKALFEADPAQYGYPNL